MIKNLIDYITNSQRPDGGFGYYKNDGSIVEPTCFSLLTLNGYNKQDKTIKAGADWLASMQNTDGGWYLFKDDNRSSPFATGLAAITLYTLDQPTFSTIITRGKKYLETVQGFNTTETMDENAWGWNEGGFISIEPSAYSVLALKMLHSKDSNRIKQGEDFFFQNICNCGGWTYGYPIDSNSEKSTNVIYKPLQPQMHITALVLLATQNSDKNPENHINLIYNEYKKSFCPLSLSLVVLALHCYNKEYSAVLSHLNNIMNEDTDLKGIPFYAALTALANLTKKGYNPLCLKK